MHLCYNVTLFLLTLTLFQGDLEVTVHTLYMVILFKKYLLIIYLAASALCFGEWELPPRHVGS